MRRILKWFELGLAAAAAGLGIYLWIYGTVTGHRDPHHGGAFVIMGGMILLILALAFAIGSVFLRARNPWGWVAQVFPLAATLLVIAPFVQISP